MKKMIKLLLVPALLLGALLADAQQRNNNGTVKLKELAPGQSRQRVDGSVDKVHKDGGGYTHSYVDNQGNKRNESIRYEQSAQGKREVKVSESIHQASGGPTIVREREQQPRFVQTQPNRDYSPAVNHNGTVKLKELAPGQSRVRADGTVDQVHRDGGGYTHTYVDNQGERHNESIRYNQTPQGRREVKISDTEHRNNGQVVTQYRNGNYDVRSSDGLRFRHDNSGGYVYQERRDTWHNRPVIYREYNNQFKTVYVENNFYGRPVYFYRPSDYGYSDYDRVLRPWSRSTAYSWDWNYNDRYRRYYSPYGVYSTPSQWLTDYMIMSLIQSRFDRVLYADNVYNYTQDSIGLNAAIREEIRMQVEQSLRYQQSAVQFDRGLDPQQIITNGRLMVVSEGMNAIDTTEGYECVLDESDVVRIVSQSTAYDQQARLRVVSAKMGSCRIGAIVEVSTEQLIEMENDFQSRLQLGMNEMRRRNLGW